MQFLHAYIISKKITTYSCTFVKKYLQILKYCTKFGSNSNFNTL